MRVTPPPFFISGDKAVVKKFTAIYNPLLPACIRWLFTTRFYMLGFTSASMGRKESFSPSSAFFFVVVIVVSAFVQVGMNFDPIRRHTQSSRN